jgi:hypothetical protein
MHQPLRTQLQRVGRLSAALDKFHGERGYKRYFNDPVGFIGDVLNVRLWKRQREIVLALTQHRKVAVRSGHKVGKTRLVACIALWWAMTRERGVVILTSSGDRQVKTQIWRELRIVYLAAGGAKRFGPEIPLDPATGLRFSDERVIYGFTTRDAEAMAGYSGDQILFCVDEASGFPESIFDAVDGNTAGGGKILATGNPTRTTGWFYDAFHEKRALWCGVHVDSRETPNVLGDEPPIKGLAGKEWVDEKIVEFGGGDAEAAEQHPTFAVRVAGNFPRQGDRSVIDLAMVEDARRRYDECTGSHPMPLEIGVDVARFGTDDSVIRGVRGNYPLPQETYNGLDGVQLAAKVAAYVATHRLGDERPIVKVDVIGVGSSCVDHLAHYFSDVLHVVPVDVGRSSDVTNADGNAEFAKLRDEVWWSLREWLRAGGMLDADPKLEAELLAPVYTFDPSLRKRVEDKDEIRKKLKRSPDRADALGLAVWRYGQINVGMVYKPSDGSARMRPHSALSHGPHSRRLRPH